MQILNLSDTSCMSFATVLLYRYIETAQLCRRACYFGLCLNSGLHTLLVIDTVLMKVRLCIMAGHFRVTLSRWAVCIVIGLHSPDGSAGCAGLLLSCMWLLGSCQKFVVIELHMKVLHMQHELTKERT